MPDLEEIDVLEKRQGLPGAAAGEAGKVERPVAPEGEGPVDEPHKTFSEKDILGPEIPVNEGEMSLP